MHLVTLEINVKYIKIKRKKEQTFKIHKCRKYTHVTATQIDSASNQYSIHTHYWLPQVSQLP